MGDRLEDVAVRMGHGVDVHKRTYLRFMPPEQKLAAVKKARQWRSENAPQQESPTEVAKLPDDVVQQLEELKRIKRAMGLED